MTAMETPWFLKSKTTEIGRVNQVFEDRLQRSITEIQFKKRKALLKIENKIEAIIQEYRHIRSEVDFSTDLDEHGNKIDPEECRSKSTGDLPRISTKQIMRPKRPKSDSRCKGARQINLKELFSHNDEKEKERFLIEPRMYIVEDKKPKEKKKRKKKHKKKKEVIGEQSLQMKKEEGEEADGAVKDRDHVNAGIKLDLESENLDGELERVVTKADQALMLPSINDTKKAKSKKKTKPKQLDEPERNNK